jgi:hypothetical protein
MSKKLYFGLGALILIAGGICFVFLLKQLISWSLIGAYNSCDREIEECNFKDNTPEDIFLRHIWGSIPPEITRIEGIEGAEVFTEGPVFVRFEATKSFITELIEHDDPNYGQYSSASCAIFDNISQYHDLIQRFPDRFKWWNPSEVSSPVCYSAQGYQGDDSKHLLIDSEHGIVYFYRNATCGLCPD